jgi:pectin methylesterase-like acyl-CoA thioesterase
MAVEMKKLGIAVLSCVVLAACSTGAPEARIANAKSITVVYEPIIYTSEAMKMVEDHCKKYGRSAVRTMSEPGPMVVETFECK